MIMEETDKEITVLFKALLKEYCNLNRHTSSEDNNNEIKTETTLVNVDLAEKQTINEFLNRHCGCGSNCQKLFIFDELLSSRLKFRNMSTTEKNCFILSQLVCFSHHSTFSHSARRITTRKRQKFEYTINADRPVCKNVFLFYYGETIQRLKRLQKTFFIQGIELPIHGNKGSKPVHACSMSDQEAVKSFIINFAATHGLPDPGRDVRKGNGRLQILLPSVMNYLSVHQIYQASMVNYDVEAVGYRTFIRIWQEELPYIVFNNPKSDLCLQCENFKKQINQVAAILDEDKENKQAKLYQEALDHINHAKKERLYYRAHALLANKNHKTLMSSELCKPYKANSVDTMMLFMGLCSTVSLSF